MNFKRKHNYIYIIFLILFNSNLLSAQNNDLGTQEAINIKKALENCSKKKGKNYSVILFGDSMSGLQSSYIMSYISSKTNTYSGLGNCNYPTKTKQINNYGSYLFPENGAEIYDVNQQNSILGNPEWAGKIGYLNGFNQKAKFLSFGVFPMNAITKIFVLTETTPSTYDIERTTNNGVSWNSVVKNATTLDTIKGMKVHTFDDTGKNKHVGYRIVWKSGRIMCLDPLFLKAGENNIYHIEIGTGGADFKLQISIPKERMRFLIDETNTKMITSSHRFEIADLEEFNKYQDVMDGWWENKKIDVLYFGQPPQTNANATEDQFIKDINAAIFEKCTSKKYLYYDLYKAMGGLQNVIDKGWGKNDPIHLSNEAYRAIAPNLLNYLGFTNSINKKK